MGHLWLVLDFGVFSVPFESTLALFFFDPIQIMGYNKEIKISEGYINQDIIYEELEWKVWV